MKWTENPTRHKPRRKIKNKILAASIALALCSTPSWAIFQNGDFETNNFNGWEKVSGWNARLLNSPPFKPEDINVNKNRGVEILKIISNGFDPRAPHLTLPRQGNFTAKVNDEINGGHVNIISQKDIITEDDRDPSDGKLYVRFTYAAVLSDPGHGANDQPYFNVQLKDLTTGKILFHDMAYSNQPGRVFYTTLYGGTWRSTPFIDVNMQVPDELIGHEIEVEVLGADCAPTGHGGYVYVDAFGANKISPQQSCLNNVKARAKPGKVQVTWGDIGADAYRVYRADKLEGPYIALGETISRYSTWLDEKVTEGKEYFYSVRPLDSNGIEVCASGSVVSVVPPHIDGGATVNRPPYFISQPNIGGDIRTPYNYLVEALDADGDDLTYRLLVAPTGMTINKDTGEINWQPTVNGIYEVNIEVSDPSGAKATQAFGVEVIDGNLPPKITNQIPTRIPSGTYFSHKVVAVDPENQALVYSLGSQAAGMYINTDGTIYWSNPQPGRYPVTVVVTDPHGAKDKQEVVIAVMSKPVFISTEVIKGTVNERYSYTAEARDMDGDKLTYQLVQAPLGMTIDSDTGEISWMPSAESVEDISITATDPDGNTATQNYKLTITNVVNRAPVITSNAVTYIGENAQYIYQPIATDPDGDTLVWSLLEAPKGIDIDVKTGKLVWTKAIAGTYSIAIQVSDRRGGIATQGYTLRVGVAANNPPQIVSVPRTNSSVGSPYSYQLIATDPDNDPLTYTRVTIPSGSTFSAGGLFSWTNPRLGKHQIALSVSDGLAVLTQSYTLNITLEAVNNLPPQITSTPKTLTVVNTVYAYQIVANDPDGDPLTYQIKQAPAGAVISADGLFTWESQATGSYPIRLVVSDGYFELEQSYDLLVQDIQQANRPPQITSTPLTLGTVNVPYQYKLIAVDPDGDLLNYLLEEGPTGAVFDTSGVLTWDKPVLGNHTIKLVVSDGQNTVEQSYVLNISSQTVSNYPPVISSVPKIQGTVGVPYSYQLVATDPDGDPLTYQIKQAPAGASIDNNGLLTWNNPSLGVHTIELSVSDGNYTVTQIFGVGINALPADNKPPRITTVPPTTGQENVPYIYNVQAIDPDNDPIVFSLDEAPTGMSIDSKTGVLQWDKPERGAHNVVVMVSDGKAWGKQHYKLNVTPSGIAGGIFTGQLFAAPQLVDINEPVTVDIVLNGGATPYETPTLTLDGNPVVITNNTATVKSSTIGLHTLVLLARDANGKQITQQTTFIVKNKADITAPKAEITAPVRSDNINVAEITTTTDIIGTASDENLAEYQLYISPADEGKWTSIAQGTKSVINGKLGVINPQTMVNGLYDVLLIVKDTGGNQTSAKIGLVIAGEQKVGQFSLSFVDLDIDMGNLPLRLTRTYDTRRQTENLDFGYGWSVNYQDVKIQTNGIPGRDWDFSEVGSGLNKKFCSRSLGTRLVTVRLPDGKMEKFDVKTSPECNSWMEQAAGTFFQIDFVPRSGTYSKLEATDVGALRVHNGVLFDYDTLDKVNPQQFKLTTKEGMTYYLDKSFGIRQIKDRHNNTLTYTKNGIQHSNGAGLIFTRDAQDRIMQVDAPDGRVLNYTYNGDGNLEGALDPKKLETKFTYHQNPKQIHQLDEIIGADGKSIFKAIFDDNGQLISQGDGLGYKVNLEHDNDNNTDKVTDRNGNTTIYVYDDQGNITKVTDSKGNVTEYTYDQFGNETSIKDALGNTTKYDYDKYGNVTKETNALGFFTETIYNKDGNPTVVTDELGRKTTSKHDSAGNLTQITNAMGSSNNIRYTTKGDLAAVTDLSGGSISYGYTTTDGKRLKVSETDAVGNVTNFEYDKNGNETARKYKMVIGDKTKELVTKATYDDNGNVLTETDENGNITSYKYDSLNQLTETKESNGKVTQYVYNERGELTEVIHPDGNKDTTTFDKNGNAIKSCSSGSCTETTYDDENRPTQVKNALGYITQTQYDAIGNVVAEIDALGNKTSYEYDAIGRQTNIIDALGNKIHSEYDPVGSLTKQTNARGYSVQNVYDDNNRLIKQIDALGQTSEYVYDEAGRIIESINAQGMSKKFDYNNTSQLYQITDTLKQKTKYGYDSRNSLTLQTDANNHMTSFTYNELGQRVSRTLPKGEKESWSYNIQGELLNFTDFNSKQTKYTYDDKDQLEKITYPDNRVITYHYDEEARVYKVQDSLNGDLLYEQDLINRTTKAITPIGKLAYIWNGNGQKLSQTINQLGSYHYTYDALGRISEIMAIDGSKTTFSYDEVGNRTKIQRSNGSESLYTYNVLNYLTKLVHKQGSQILASFDYTLDESGRKTKVKEIIQGQERTLTYQYDSEGRLLEEIIIDSGITSTYSYNYDAQGNRLTKLSNGVKTSYTYDANDQLLKEEIGDVITTYQWDKNGNLTQKKVGDQTINYTWSSTNRLTKVTEGNKTITYRYDGEDRRIGKTITANGTTTETVYLIDSQRSYNEIMLAKTRTNNGPWQEQLYLYAPDGVGDLLTQTESGTEHLYQDGKGSTRLVLNQMGNEIFHYDAFGNPLKTTPTNSHTAHRYVGEVLDEETGFYYFRARLYDPKVGRFISRDSFEGIKTNPISLNPYLYAHSDPVNGIDPSGYFGLGDLMSGMNIQSTLQMMARDMLMDYVFEKLFEGTMEQPGLFDIITMMLLKTITSSAETPEPAPMARSLARSTNKKDEDHHTIPQYMCGPTNYKLTARIDGQVHDDIHSKMRAYVTTIDVAGVATQAAFRYKSKKKFGDINTPTKDLAVKPFGRQGISSALAAYYARNGYIWTPVKGPNRTETKALSSTMFGYFRAERKQYVKKDAIKMRANTECKKIESQVRSKKK